MVIYNSNIDISSYNNISKEEIKNIEKEVANIFIPEEFSWNKYFITDNTIIKNKKKLISDVKNQYACGCCWAISCATAISDAFVIKNLVNYKPNISYTYALSKYPQQQCSGGSSRILLENIKNGHGIKDDNCINNNWCSNNSDCSKDATLHFYNFNQKKLSELIPYNTNCNNSHYLYKISKVYSMMSDDTYSYTYIQNLIKKHILVRGPVVAGFLVQKNFPSGKFIETNHRIYIENINYNNEENYNKIIGSHSIVIVGWGIYNKIPFWYCRNSWGIHWGENGYFKIAMYPINKISQFTKNIKVLNKNKIKLLGGVTGFLVTEKPVLIENTKNTTNLTHIFAIVSVFLVICIRNV